MDEEEGDDAFEEETLSRKTKDKDEGGNDSLACRLNLLEKQSSLMLKLMSKLSRAPIETEPS